MRVSQNDREYVLDRLRVAVEEDRIDLAEFNERSERALRARVYSELDELVSDLRPLAPPGAAVPTDQPATPRPYAENFPRDQNGRIKPQGAPWRIIGRIALGVGAVLIVLAFVAPDVLLWFGVGVLALVVLVFVAAIIGLF